MPSRRPSLGARLGAMMRGDVSADEVVAMLSAGDMVYDDYLAADRLREDLVAAGIGPSAASPAETSQLLCAWNAHALQSLGRAFVEAEERSGSSGSLSRVTAEQVLRLLREVPAWSARARRASADPGFDVGREIRLPAPLPPWVIVEPCPRSHLNAMRSAGTAMLEQIEAALADVDRLVAAGGGSSSAPLHAQAAEVATRLRYAEGMMLGNASGTAVHERAEAALREAVTTSFYLGQVVARPRLAQVAPPPGPLTDPPRPRTASGGGLGGWLYDEGHHGRHHGHH